MFSYKKVEIRQVLKVAPEETYKNVLVVGESFEENDDADIGNHYFLIEDTVIYDEEGAHEYSGYMKAYFPSRIINEMYLYLVKSKIPNYEMFFIDPLVYESTSNDELDLLLIETIERIQLSKDVDLIESLYLNELFFYELKEDSRKKYGHQFMTNDLVELVCSDIEEFAENYTFDYHVEPIIYRLNQDEMIFVGEKDIKNKTLRLLYLNKEGLLYQKERLHVDDVVNFFESENYSVQDLMNAYNIKKEIESLGKILS